MEDAFTRQSSFFSAILSGKKPGQPEKEETKEYEIWETDIAGRNVLEDIARWTGVPLPRVKQLASKMQEIWETEDNLPPTLKRIKEMIHDSENSDENTVIGFLYGLAIGRYHAMFRRRMDEIKEKLAGVLGKEGIKTIVAMDAEDAAEKLKGILEGIVKKEEEE